MADRRWTIKGHANRASVHGPYIEPGSEFEVTDARAVEELEARAYREGVQDLAAALNDADVGGAGLDWSARMDAVESVLAVVASRSEGEK